MMTLAAKTVLITGASRGLGLELVSQMLRLPTAPEVLIATCRTPESAKDLQALATANSGLKILKLDVEKPADLDTVFQETTAILGDRGLNLLINNAGVNNKDTGSDLRTVGRDNLNKHFDINCSAPIMMTQKFLPLLEKAADKETKTLSCSQAAVVMVSSVMASQELTLKKGHGTTLVYKCSKSALNMATVLISRELSPLGILAMNFHPGWVQTDMGGGQAPLTAQDSISQVLQVLARAGPESQGKTTSYDGEIFPF